MNPGGNLKGDKAKEDIAEIRDMMLDILALANKVLGKTEIMADFYDNKEREADGSDDG